MSYCLKFATIFGQVCWNDVLFICQVSRLLVLEWFRKLKCLKKSWWPQGIKLLKLFFTQKLDCLWESKHRVVRGIVIYKPVLYTKHKITCLNMFYCFTCYCYLLFSKVIASMHVWGSDNKSQMVTLNSIQIFSRLSRNYFTKRYEHTLYIYLNW